MENMDIPFYMRTMKCILFVDKIYYYLEVFKHIELLKN